MEQSREHSERSRSAEQTSEYNVFFDRIKSASSFDELEAIIEAVNAYYRAGPRTSHKEIGIQRIERECYSGIPVVEIRLGVEIDVEDDDGRELIDPIALHNLSGAVQIAYERITDADN